MSNAGPLATSLPTLESLARIAARDPELHAFRRVLAAEARGLAAAPPLGPLSGMPFAVKENIDVAGLPTRAGRRDEPAAAAADAPVVARLRAHGAVLVGTLAMDELAIGATTENAHYGRTENPRRAGHAPGGSSGGSGAAVAAGLVAFALGTDTLGSVRIPASYCGVVGFKPTPGRVSRRGVVPLAPSLDAVGVLAPDVATAARAFTAMAAYDADDATSLPLPVPVPAFGAPPVLGIPETVLDAVPFEPVVLAGFARAVFRLRAAGYQVRRVATPGWEIGRSRRAGILLMEAEAAALHADDLAAGRFSPRVAALLAFGRDCGAVKLARALEAIADVRRAMAVALSACDALLLPTTPGTAHPFEHPPALDPSELLAPANLAGLPSISLPMAAGAAADDLPVGVQLTARAFADEALLDLAARVAPLLGPPPIP